MENSNFIKFIIKKIVKVVYVKDHLDISRPFSDWYRIEKVAIDDNLIREIIDEGSRYGLSEKKSQFCIGQADRMINFTPSVTEYHSSFDICSLPNGTHTEFIYENPSFGTLTIDAIKDGKHNFLVLKSDMAALCWEDNIVFTVNKLQCGTYPAFCVRRYHQNTLSTANYLCPGKLIQVNVYSPGITHEIIDAKTDFRKKKKSKVTELVTTTVFDPSLKSDNQSWKKNTYFQENKIKETPEVHYLWPPSRWNPIAFCFTNMDRNVKSPDFPPFMATVYSINNAEITINPMFIEVLQSMVGTKTKSFLYLLESIIKTCKIQKLCGIPELVSNIIVVSKGKLSLSPTDNNIWIMEEAPIIILE